MTKGYQTTEFYLSTFSVLLAGLLASGALTNQTLLQVVGAVSGFLASLGYVGARAYTKAANERGKGIVAAANLERAMRGE
jgi:hypothetical protein